MSCTPASALKLPHSSSLRLRLSSCTPQTSVILGENSEKRSKTKRHDEVIAHRIKAKNPKKS